MTLNGEYTFFFYFMYDFGKRFKRVPNLTLFFVFLAKCYV